MSHSSGSPENELAALMTAAEALTNPTRSRTWGASGPPCAQTAGAPDRTPGHCPDKTATGIAASILEKQLAELRRRVSQRRPQYTHRTAPFRAPAMVPGRNPSQRGQCHHRADIESAVLSQEPLHSTTSPRKSSCAGRCPGTAALPEGMGGRRTTFALPNGCSCAVSTWHPSWSDAPSAPWRANIAFTRCVIGLTPSHMG